MFRYPTYMAVETLTIALVTEDGQSFEDLGIEEREAGQVIIKCRAAEPMRDGAPCEWNKMGSDGYPFCASSTEVMRLLEQNAKLRELCADMYGFIKRMDEDCGDVTFSDCFDYCKHDTADDGCCKTGECWYEQRMRELGIEVSV